MRKDKKILLFSDLEGTILRESDGKYDEEAMYNFLSQIDKLQQLTDADVNLHLVSPVYREQMEEIMDKIDENIARYNKLRPFRDRIPMIECGSFLPDKGMYEEEFLGDRAIPLKMPIDSNQFDTARYGKANYVRTWCEIYEERKQLIMPIYCGNGRNDLSAMECVKEKNGFVVCPNNSRTLAKEKADFTSSKTDLQGITEGIEKINEKIEQRVSPKAKDEKQSNNEEH